MPTSRHCPPPPRARRFLILLHPLFASTSSTSFLNQSSIVSFRVRGVPYDFLIPACVHSACKRCFVSSFIDGGVNSIFDFKIKSRRILILINSKDA